MTFSLLWSRAVADRSDHSRTPFRVFLFLAASASAVLGSAMPASAQNRFWITNVGGAFATNANWSTTAGGAGGATPPAAADIANFTLSSLYTVNFAANVTNAGLLVRNGSVVLDLNGNAYTVTGATGTTIGTNVAETGRLTIKNGTLGVDTATDEISLGTTASTGFLTVSTGGRLGNGTINPNLIVGKLGTGTLIVEGNGSADLGLLSLGHGSAAATGTTTVSGPNAVLASSIVNIGQAGMGTLNLQNAGTMTTAGVTTLGVQLGSNGAATVAGALSRWTQTSALLIGSAGAASLSVQSAGSLETAGAVAIGIASTGVGTAIVTGTDSTWNMASTLQIGVNGLGNLAMTSGGKVNTSSVVHLGVNAGSDGNAVVTGTGSRWSVGETSVGRAGSGKLTVSAGGVMNTSGNATLGNLATGVGIATVSGTGSAWNITGGLSIAALGTGTLTVDDQGSLSASGALTIGDPAGTPTGTLNFNGGTISAGSFTRSGSSVFNWTNGTLLVAGGVLNNSGANLTINGGNLNDIPALRLSAGAQSTAVNLPNLTIGSNRQGALIVSGGSSFQTTTASVGSLDGGTGSLHVEGLNSVFSTTGDLGVGGTTATAGGLGGITLGPGGTVTAGGTLRLWDGGTISLAGGTLQFNNLAANGGKAVFSSGTIQVLSNFNADAATLDALLGPAHTLGVGRKVETLNNTMNLQSNLTVSGGAVAGNILSVSTDVIARFENGATGAFSNGIINPIGARVYVTDSIVGAGTTFTNIGELHLAGRTATVNATLLANTGLVNGSGRINSVVTNNAAGQLRVAAGELLQILGSSGSNTNNGLVDVDGGSIEFGRALTNSSVSPSTGLIAARDATLRFQAGLLNSGAITFTGGNSDVFGDITNQNNLATPGRIVVTGGAQANFFDDVVNNGTIQVSAAGALQSTAVFLGSLSGNGVSGGGHVFLEGDTRPGFSPGTMSFGGNVSFGPLSTLDVELAGTTPGTQYDRVTVADSANLDGTLNVSLVNGFRPSIGQSFEIFTAAGGITGTFAQESLPALAGGASWEVNATSQSITLSVGGVLGDFNLDGRVDAADYTVWRDLLGSNSLAADASGNGSVDQIDYNIWKANFGAVAVAAVGAGGQAAAVPEPSTAILIGLLAASAFGSSRKKWGQTG